MIDLLLTDEEARTFPGCWRELPGDFVKQFVDSPPTLTDLAGAISGVEGPLDTVHAIVAISAALSAWEMEQERLAALMA